jgi:PAS domain S-box-containing protein
MTMAQDASNPAQEGSQESALNSEPIELDQFFNLTPEMLCIVSFEGRFLKLNAAWKRVLGWSNEELERLPVIDFLHPDDIELGRRIGCALRASPASCESVTRFRCRDGSYRWLEWRSVSRAEGYIYAAAHDITPRVENERLLRESEERYRLLIEFAPFMVAVHDAGRIVFVNPAGVQLTAATSADQLLGKSVLDLIPPESREPAAKRMRDLVHQKSSQRVEERLVCLDGRVRDLEISSMMIPFDGKDATLLVGIDVTDRKDAESERLKLEGQLRQSQRLESIGRLAGGVAHDFNNLLTVILGCADSLLSRDGLDPHERTDLHEISEAAQRAASLTRQLLAFSRQQVLQPRIIDVKDVVTQATRMLRRVLGEDIELALEVDSAPALVFADPGQLEQVLVNLAVNARDAMPAGGDLTIEISRVTLDQEFLAAHPEAAVGAHVHIAVTDTGHGMDEATRSRIFEPFFSTKSDIGTGLGLATVYGIIRQSGGYIWVQSELGLGSCFKLYLPLFERSSAELPNVAAREVPHCAETILLVEDEDSVRNVVRKVLSKAGYAVLVAANGEQALACVQAHPEPIHLLLTDVVMPRMTGRDLAQRLAQLRPDTRVLYMSGYTPDSIVHQGVLEEGIEFIQKPLMPAQLLAKIRAMFDAG